LKILQVNASYKPAYIYGGPTMSVSKLSEELTKAGCEIEVFTTTANGAGELPVTPGEFVDVDGVKVTYFKRLTRDHTHYSPELLKALLKRVHEFDVVHIHAWWNLVSVLACRAALKAGVPVVVSPRGTLSDYSFSKKNSLPKKLIHGFLGKSLLSKSFMHVTSDREKRAMEKLVGSKKIFNIPNFVDIPAGVPIRADGEAGYLRLLFLSRIDEKKGLEILFHALKDINMSYRLTIAGDGDSEYINSLKLLAENNGIAPYVDWIGFQQERKFDVLREHDLLVLPSYDENFGNVVIESLAMGTAVLVSRNVGLADYVEQNRLGWVCEQNPSSLDLGLHTAFGDSDTRTKIREQAPAIIRSDFNEAALTDRYIGMYKEIIANG